MEAKKLIFIFCGLLLLQACQSMQEAGKVLRNEKIRTTDEFLIKKREPLTLPPDMNTLPEPNTTISKSANEKNKIKEILQVPEEKTGSNSSSEEYILKQIKKQ